MNGAEFESAGIRRGVIAVSSECGLQVASGVRVANTFLARAMGLLGHRDLAVEEGLLIEPGGSVHTFGMRFAIDVLFLDRDMRIIKLVSALQGCRIALAPRATRRVLEITTGRALFLGLRVGMRLILERGSCAVSVRSAPSSADNPTTGSAFSGSSK
jgi:uncharacterized membrane protein (UPF0127 family)